MDSRDIPNPVDFRNPREAKQWAAGAIQRRPSRPEFFHAFVQQLRCCLSNPCDVLEIGAGPGFLAEQILKHCDVASYTLLDVSAPMLEMARDRLAIYLDRVSFVRQDFRLTNWSRALGKFDAVVTMQAIHEVQHKQRVPALYNEIYNILQAPGYFLVSDFYYDPETRSRNSDLFMTVDEQNSTLVDAGFEEVHLVLDKDGMTFHRARKLTNEF